MNNSGEIVYTYHTHGDGYCNETPVFHSHTEQTGSCYTAVKCGGSLGSANDDGYCLCLSCKKWTSKSSAKDTNYKCARITGYSLSCGKTTSTVESYYCSLSEDSILSATIVFQ